MTQTQPLTLELAESLERNAEIDAAEGCNPTVVKLERDAVAELRRLSAENEQLRAELGQRESDLAACRGAMPVPARGTPLERQWAAAVGDPGEVAGYVADSVKQLAARAPLSDEQIDEYRGATNFGYGIDRDDYIRAFRDAERAHGIGDPA